MNLIDRESLLEKIQFRIEPYGVVGATIKDCVEKTREIILADPIVKDINVPSWIPVTERLPERGQEVIVYSGGILSPTVFAYHFWNKDFTSWAHITHWMPLPEPPKEVE